MRTKQPKTELIMERLRQRYPQVSCPLNYSNAWELLVATILSAQCTDAKVNTVTPQLFARYQTVAEFATADVLELKEIIRPLGLYNTKSKNIIAAAQRVHTVYNGIVPDSMAELLTLPGVARKTASVVLAHWYNINAGFTVDTHVARVSKRLGLVKGNTPEQIERELQRLVPQADWANASLRLIFFGREVCHARRPLCEQCPLLAVCPTGQELLKQRSNLKS